MTVPEVDAGGADDPIRSFYEQHPYPPPVDDLAPTLEAWRDGRRRRVEHLRTWPERPQVDDPTILVAGCGTSQAAAYAARYPEARVVGIDVSSAGLAANAALAERHGLDRVTLAQTPVEQVGELGETFDLVICTGVLHHLQDPLAGLRALRGVVALGGALRLMVYATHGRVGVTMLQEYCRRLGIGPTVDEVDELAASLRELPAHHPMAHLLRETPDFHDRDALADALLNPRERSYTVPELLQTLDGVGFRFERWVRQAPYLPHCGSLSEVPHGERIAALPPAEQYAAVELFRGTMLRHSVVARRDDDPAPSPAVRFDDESWRDHVPVLSPTVAAIEDRLPPGAAVAVLDRAHTDPDLVLFLDADDKHRFEQIDGQRPMGEIASTPDLFRRLWWHDHILVDTSAATVGRR